MFQYNKKIKVMDIRIKKAIRRRELKMNLHLASFICLFILNIVLLWKFSVGVIDFELLSLIFPIALIMYLNTKMWDLLNDVNILSKYIHDKEYREKYNKTNK